MWVRTISGAIPKVLMLIWARMGNCNTIVPILCMYGYIWCMNEIIQKVSKSLENGDGWRFIVEKLVENDNLIWRKCGYHMCVFIFEKVRRICEV